MNADSFLDCLKNPSRVYQINYHELKSLVLQYPYCHNLRYLLVLKSYLDKHKDYEKNLPLAATYSLDRSFLYKILNDQPEQSGEALPELQIGEDYIELPALGGEESGPASDENGPVELPISNGELAFELGDAASREEEIKEIPAFEPEPEESGLEDLILEEEKELVEGSSEPLSDQPVDHEIDESIEALFDELEDEEPEAEPQTTTAGEALSEENPEDGDTLWDALTNYFPEGNILVQEEFEKAGALAAAAVEAGKAAFGQLEKDRASQKKEKMKEEKKENFSEPGKKPPAPSPKHTFSSWLRQFEPPRVVVSWEAKENEETRSKAREETEEVETHKTSAVRAIARQSVSEREDIATETLAEILVKQGSIKKAITMYKRLCLLIPDKSSFFAERIEELKKQL